MLSLNDVLSAKNSVCGKELENAEKMYYGALALCIVHSCAAFYVLGEICKYEVKKPRHLLLYMMVFVISIGWDVFVTLLSSYTTFPVHCLLKWEYDSTDCLIQNSCNSQFHHNWKCCPPTQPIKTKYVLLYGLNTETAIFDAVLSVCVLYVVVCYYIELKRRTSLDYHARIMNRNIGSYLEAILMDPVSNMRPKPPERPPPPSYEEAMRSSSASWAEYMSSCDSTSAPSGDLRNSTSGVASTTRGSHSMYLPTIESQMNLTCHSSGRSHAHSAYYVTDSTHRPTGESHIHSFHHANGGSHADSTHHSSDESHADSTHH